MSPEKKQKITEAREKATEEKEKVRRDVNALHHFTLTHVGFKFSFPDSQHVNLDKVILAWCMWWYLATWGTINSKQAYISFPSVFHVWRCVIVMLLSVYEAQHGNSEEHQLDLFILDPLPLKKHSSSSWWELTATFHHKNCFFWAACRHEIAMRKCWRMWRHTHLATWRKWKPYLNSRRRRRGRGSAFWSRPSSPSTDILTSPTTRGKKPGWASECVRSVSACRYKHGCVFLCQCEGSVQWTPPHSDVHQWAGWSQMVEEQPWSRHAHQLAKDSGTFYLFNRYSTRETHDIHYLKYVWHSSVFSLVPQQLEGTQVTLRIIHLHNRGPELSRLVFWLFDMSLDFFGSLKLF